MFSRLKPKFTIFGFPYFTCISLPSCTCVIKDAGKLGSGRVCPGNFVAVFFDLGTGGLLSSACVG